MNVPTADPPRITSILNFRDVGGLTSTDGRLVATGRLYRSGHLGQARQSDLDELARIGLRTIIDLRGPGDIAQDGANRIPEGARRVSLPMFDSDGWDPRTLFDADDQELFEKHFGEGRAEQAMLSAAVDLVVRPDRCRGFAAMLEEVAKPGATPALIHCSAGKDRTGWAASLILSLLGVDEEQVVAHYVESDRYRSNEFAVRVARWEAAGIDWSMLAPLFGVHESYARAAFRAVDDHWGGLDRYLHDGLGLGPDHVERLREQLLVATE